MSNRKAAAARFRKFIRHSNELHAGYLEDAVMLGAYDRFANWQLDYLLPFFDDIYGKPGYTEAPDFTLNFSCAATSRCNCNLPDLHCCAVSKSFSSRRWTIRVPC